jgi:nicotinate-nucleotide adenylyltransferase
VQRVAIPRLDIASTDLRERLGSGRPIDGLVPPAVVRTIRARGLYTGGR